MKKTKKCKGGCKLFWVTESTLWEGYLVNNKQMDCQNKDCEIREIACQECLTEYTEDYFIEKGIEINFN